MQYRILTIEREYASGGSEIGSRAAALLGIPCYGQEILQMAAERCGSTAARMLQLEETATSSFLYSMHLMGQMSKGEPGGISENDRLQLAEEQVIRDLAAQGPCVIVGRCASYALRERNDVLSAFIHATMAMRITRAEQTYGIQTADAPRVLQQFDKRRSHYYNANTKKQWKDISNYALMLDSSDLGVEACAALLAAAFRGA